MRKIMSSVPLLVMILAARPAPASDPSAPGNVPAVSGACAFLTAAEIEAVQGAPVIHTKAHEVSGQGFLVSQCFYEAADFPHSVSLVLTRPDGSAAAPGAGRDRWRELFHRDADERRASEERDRENEANGPQERPPRPVDGVGDEAFWTGSPQVGALYVLKGDVFLRISVGGGEAEELRIDRTRSLARKALRRLQRA